MYKIPNPLGVRGLEPLPHPAPNMKSSASQVPVILTSSLVFRQSVWIWSQNSRPLL